MCAVMGTRCLAASMIVASCLKSSLFDQTAVFLKLFLEKKVFKSQVSKRPIISDFMLKYPELYPVLRVVEAMQVELT